VNRNSGRELLELGGDTLTFGRHARVAVGHDRYCGTDLYQDSRFMTCGPLAHADRHDAPGLVGQSVPSVAAVIDDGVV
jgi:hypothetical protein